MNYIMPNDRKQGSMFTSLDDMIGAVDQVRLIDAVVDLLIKKNPNLFEKGNNEETGRPRYRPNEMLKLFVYGYLNGISSSRKLEKATYKNIDIKWLLGDLTPDHWTISNYRIENSEQIKLATKKFTIFLKENEYINLNTTANDGCKIKANAKRTVLTEKDLEKRIKNVESEIEKYLQKIEYNDTEEDINEETTGDIESSDKDIYLKKIIELEKENRRLKELEEKLKASDKNYISPTDTDANLMRTRDGKMPAYNVQITADSENKFIVATEVVTDETDIYQLSNMVNQIEAATGEKPKEIIADKGYYNLDMIEEIEQKGVECFVAVPTRFKDKETIKFEYNEETQEYKCSEGKSLKLTIRNKKKNNSIVDVYQGIDCDGCKLRSECTKSKVGRIVNRYHNQQNRDNFIEKMKTPGAIEKIRKRKTIIEHVFGTIKCWMGKQPILLKGKEGVKTELDLYSWGYNIKRLMNIEIFDTIMQLIGEFNWEIA
jgi:transposase